MASCDDGSRKQTSYLIAGLQCFGGACARLRTLYTSHFSADILASTMLHTRTLYLAARCLPTSLRPFPVSAMSASVALGSLGMSSMPSQSEWSKAVAFA